MSKETSMKTACILAAEAVVCFCEADSAKAKGPHGGRSVSSNSSGNRYVRTANYPTYTKQVFTQKPIVITPPTLVQKTVILPVKTADLKHPLHHKHHRHRHHGIDIPDVEISDPDLDDDDADESCELADGISDAKPTPSLSTGASADDDADDDDDDDDDD
jgi:hypothetical protein